MFNCRWRLIIVGMLLTSLSAASTNCRAAVFTSLFDGTSLNGWVEVGGHPGPDGGYIAKDGILECPAGCWDNLFTKQQYSDFIFKFDFRLTPGANNGVGLRAPLQGDSAYMGMECQILDNTALEYKNLLPGQYMGSLYKIAPAKRGALNPVGTWNHEIITAIGRHVTVVLNHKTIVDTDLNNVSDVETLAEHPGMLRPTGHIGFLGHEPGQVDFKNISVKDLSKPTPDNRAPHGFTALFNGRNLNGWQGLVGDPISRAAMAPQALSAALKAATQDEFKHWYVKGGVITYKNPPTQNLCTVRTYANFELQLDWKLSQHGDSGIYLRGYPQVQIWNNPLGSGGLYNNVHNNSNPMVVADKPVGEWNHYDILMIGDNVTVYLNNKLVTWNVPLGNYWKRGVPVLPSGQIELQYDQPYAFFKNIYIREIP